MLPGQPPVEYMTAPLPTLFKMGYEDSNVSAIEGRLVSELRQNPGQNQQTNPRAFQERDSEHI